MRHGLRLVRSPPIRRCARGVLLGLEPREDAKASCAFDSHRLRQIWKVKPSGCGHRLEPGWCLRAWLSSSPAFRHFRSVNRVRLGAGWKPRRISNGICGGNSALRQIVIGRGSGSSANSKSVAAVFDSLTGRQFSMELELCSFALRSIRRRPAGYSGAGCWHPSCALNAAHAGPIPAA